MSQSTKDFIMIEKRKMQKGAKPYFGGARNTSRLPKPPKRHHHLQPPDLSGCKKMQTFGLLAIYPCTSSIEI
jgi:hypothetical protein